MYQFTVAPKRVGPDQMASFPIDMLRRGECWPAYVEDLVTIAVSIRSHWTNATVTLISGTEPKAEDWEQMDWTLLAVRNIK